MRAQPLTLVLWAIVNVLSLVAIPRLTDAATSDRTQFCPIRVSAYVVPGHADDLALALWADDVAGMASGTINVYAGGYRYHIPFTDALAADSRVASSVPTPMIAAIAAADFESAYVASLDGGSCQIHQPFTERPIEPAAFNPHGWRDAVEGAVMHPPVAPIAETAIAPACQKPYVRASTIHVDYARYPENINSWFGGAINVTVALAADGSVTAMRIDDATTRDRAYNVAAARAVGLAKFKPEIYRCQAVSGVFRFIVYFEKN